MPDETQQPAPLSTAETLAQIKAVIQDLEVLASRLAEDESSATTTPIPTLTALTSAVADLVDTLDEAAQERTAADEPSVTAVPATNAWGATAQPEEATVIEPPGSLPPEAETSDWLDDIKPEPPAPKSSAPQPSTPSSSPHRLAQLQAVWARVLQSIRSLLPGNLSEQLSDPILTAIVGGVIVLALWLPGALTGESTPEPAAIVPTPEPVATTTAVPETTPPPAVQTQPTVPQPPAVLPPARSPQRLTPEQNLIAAIQEQVAQITDQYAEGLIQSLQVDFLAGRLRVMIGADWYDLNADRQDQVAAEVLARARRLDFTKVEMIDEDAVTLARSPVIGDKMIIFQRKPLAVGEETS
ncbi:MAG: hypothetical protein AAGG51_05145 [Cyanobacteria bacterium P01_G01_bin.54]